MQVQRQSTGATLHLGTAIASGGEGSIHPLIDSPDWVAKLYHQPTPELAQKLAAMYANPPADTSGDREAFGNRNRGHVAIAWVRDLLLQNGRVVGFLMPRVREGLPLHSFYTPSSRRDRCPLFNYQYLHRTACNLATAVSRLHARGYVIGDVNESNILVSRTALVTLVDTDSFQVFDGDRRYPCPVGKPEFTPPELQGKTLRRVHRTPEHDRFGLAVLIFQMLMEGTHPFAGVYLKSGDPPPIEHRIAAGHFAYSRLASNPYRPTPIAPPITLLHPELQHLFAQCFEAGHHAPRLRPSAQTWIRALRHAEAELLTCSANPQHRYGRHLPACPWCDRTQKLGGRDPFPRNLQEAGRLQQLPKPRRRVFPRRPSPHPNPGSTTPPRSPVRVPTPIGYTISFPAPPSVSRIRAPHGLLSDLGTDFAEYVSRYKYDFLGGTLAIAATLAGGIYLSQPESTPSSGSQPVAADPATLSEVSKPAKGVKEDISNHAAARPWDWSLRLGDRRFDHRDRVMAIAVSPSGDWFASSSQDGTIKVWSFPDRVLVQSRRLSSVLQLPEDRVEVLAVAGDGETLVGATARALQTWNAATLDLEDTQPLPLSVQAIAATSRQSLNVGGVSAGDIAVWDVRQGQERQRWQDSGERVVTVSTDGKTLVTGGEAIAIWDVETGELKQTLARSLPDDGVAALSPDGQLLAVSAPEDDGAIQLWDARSGALHHTETASHISSLSFNPDGDTLVSGDLYGAIGVWYVQRSPESSSKLSESTP